MTTIDFDNIPDNMQEVIDGMSMDELLANVHSARIFALTPGVETTERQNQCFVYLARKARVGREAPKRRTTNKKEAFDSLDDML